MLLVYVGSVKDKMSFFELKWKDTVLKQNSMDFIECEFINRFDLTSFERQALYFARQLLKTSFSVVKPLMFIYISLVECTIPLYAIDL